MDYDDPFLDEHEKDAIERFASYLPSPCGPYLAKGSAKQRKIKCGFFSALLCLILLLVVILIVAVGVFFLGSDSDLTDNNNTNTNTTVQIPQIAATFTTSFSAIVYFGNIPNQLMNGTYWEDSTTQHRRLTYEAYLPGAFPDYPLNYTEVVEPNGVYRDGNGICRVVPSKYSDPFSWLDAATYGGTENIDGVDYTSWSLTIDDTTDDDDAVYTISLLANGNIPYQLNQTFVSSYLNFSEAFTFGSDFNETTIDGSEWQPPASCASELICDLADVEDVELVRYHSADDWVMENRNFGDYMGVASFLCWNYMFQYTTDPTQEVVSLYTVSMNTTWGKYGKCNFGYCAGSDNFTVGHSATGTVTDLEEQCSNNTDIGNWYSLTNITECAEGDTPDSGDCAWKLVEYKNNITVQCLLDQGFISDCLADNLMPYPTASATLANAFSVCPSVSMDDFPGNSTITTQTTGAKVASKKKHNVMPTSFYFSHLLQNKY